jgi:hypothetical protein
VSDLCIEGYVIVSADGMLADADHLMPDELKFDADMRFFAAALDRTDLIVHGRHSQEDQPNSPLRKRIILTRKIASLAPDLENPRASLWNPAGSSFAEACDYVGLQAGIVAIIGGPVVFDLFMDRYDTFWLSQASRVWLPGGQHCFGGVPERSPQEVLAAHGLRAGSPRILDCANDVTATPWRRVS